MLKEIIYDDKRLSEIKENIKSFAKPNASENIVRKIFEELNM